MKIKLIWFLFLTIIIADGSFVLAVPPPEQETGGQERMRQMQETEKALREKIEKKEVAPSIEEKLPETAAPEVSGQNFS